MGLSFRFVARFRTPAELCRKEDRGTPQVLLLRVGMNQLLAIHQPDKKQIRKYNKTKRNANWPVSSTAGRRSRWRTIAKPELVYLEGTASEPTRPPGSGDPAGNFPGHRNSGFALTPPAPRKPRGRLRNCGMKMRAGRGKWTPSMRCSSRPLNPTPN